MNNKFDLSRFKNYGLWVSIFSLAPMVLELFGVEVVAEQYQPIVNTILAILVGLGIVSNPSTSSKWYLDDEKKETNVIK